MEHFIATPIELCVSRWHRSSHYAAERRMAAKLRPCVIVPRRVSSKAPAWLKPAAVSFSGLLDGQLLENEPCAGVGRLIEELGWPEPAAALHVAELVP